MANIIAFPQSRTLAQVLAELMLARAERDRLFGQVAGRDPTVFEDAHITDLEDRIWLREDEARAMIEAATSVPWTAIQGANL